MADKSILVDSGATDNFIDPRLIKRLGLGTQNWTDQRRSGTLMELTIRLALFRTMLI
jgi:hypothetical protein